MRSLPSNAFGQTVSHRDDHAASNAVLAAQTQAAETNRRYGLIRLFVLQGRWYPRGIQAVTCWRLFVPSLPYIAFFSAIRAGNPVSYSNRRRERPTHNHNHMHRKDLQHPVDRGKSRILVYVFDRGQVRKCQFQYYLSYSLPTMQRNTPSTSVWPNTPLTYNWIGGSSRFRVAPSGDLFASYR